MIRIFKFLPPIVLVASLYTVTAFIVVSRFLLGTYFGALIAVIGIYFCVDGLGFVKPLSMSQLFIWLDDLNPDYKFSMLSSLITVVGFVIAFNTATRNWQAQMNAQLKLQVADEVERFFSQVGDSITAVEIYMTSLVEASQKIENGCLKSEADFSVKYNQEAVGEYFLARKRLSAASVEVHGLKSRNFNILSAGWGVVSAFDKTVDSLRLVTSAMWINVPIVDLDSERAPQQFVELLDVEKCNHLIDVCRSESVAISAAAGGIRGYLLNPISSFTLASYLTLLSNRKEFIEAFKMLRSSLNK